MEKCAAPEETLRDSVASYEIVVGHIRYSKGALSDDDFGNIESAIGRTIARAADRDELKYNETHDISEYLDGSCELLLSTDSQTHLTEDNAPTAQDTAEINSEAQELAGTGLRSTGEPLPSDALVPSIQPLPDETSDANDKGAAFINHIIKNYDGYAMDTSITITGNDPGSALKVNEFKSASQQKRDIPLLLFWLGHEKLYEHTLKENKEKDYFTPDRTIVDYLIKHGYFAHIKVSSSLFTRQYITLSSKGWACYTKTDTVRFLSSGLLCNKPNVKGNRSMVVPAFLRFSTDTWTNEVSIHTALAHELFVKYQRNYQIYKHKLNGLVCGDLFCEKVVRVCSAIFVENDEQTLLDALKETLSELKPADTLVLIVASLKDAVTLATTLACDKMANVIYSVIYNEYQLYSVDGMPAYVAGLSEDHAAASNEAGQSLLTPDDNITIEAVSTIESQEAEDNIGDYEVAPLIPEESDKDCASVEDAPYIGEEVTSESDDEAPREVADEHPEQYIHPINPIKPAKILSEQKLRELVNRAGNVLGFLIDKLVFTGLMDENRVFNAFAQMLRPLTREQCIEIFVLLERKGLLCTYEFEGRNILCFTELMESCLQKPSISSTLKRLLNLKKIGRIHTTGIQDMPLGQFTQQMRMVDQYTKAIDMLAKDEENAKKFDTFSWNHEKHCFLMNLSLDGRGLLPLRITVADEFALFTPTDEEGVISCADELPVLSNVEDKVHYCLTPQGLFHWSDSQWVSITPIDIMVSDSEQSSDNETDIADSVAFASLPEEIGEETVDAAAFVAPDPNVFIKPTATNAGQAERLWLDDLSEENESEPDVAAGEYANLCSVEIAGRLLNATANCKVPSDERMATLIYKLLVEGVRSNDVHNLHDQLVEAIVLAKLLSSNDAFPMCRNIYYQLHAAIPLFRENGTNTGAVLSSIFAEEMEYTSAAKLCAYIYGMLFPIHAHDHTFSALYNNAFTNYESQFPGLDILKPLYHKAMEGLKLVSTAFSPVNLATLSDTKRQQERMNTIRARARELLKSPTVKVMINGVPELIDICFGNQTDLYIALEIVSENGIDMRGFVKGELAKYCKDDEIDTTTLAQFLDSQWNVAAQKYSSRRMGIKYDARKHSLRWTTVGEDRFT